MAPFSFPKSFQNLPKIDPKRHQFFDRFLHRFFIHFSSNLGLNLGPCWQLFRSKWGGRVEGPLLFCWVYVIFRFFGANPLGYPIGPCPKADGVPLLGSVFGPMWARFSKVLWSILQVLRLFFWLPSWRCLAALFNVSLLALDGLVGLREAQRIFTNYHRFSSIRTCFGLF